MPQNSIKKDKKARMAKYDPENAHAWNIILAEVKKLKASGLRQHEIAKKMGVNKDTVSRWLSEERGGERTTFGAMLRYADALKIPYNELLRDNTFDTSTAQTVTAYDLAVKNVLEEFAHDSDVTISDIAKKANLPAIEINAVFNGSLPLSPTIMNAVCSAVEVGESMVHKRATKKLEQEQKDTTASAVRTA
ncbi:helix-turn-helix transcriptional regulator [Halodesulfovibrio sp.]|jgi:transcriptional regulator with XRE-family HTH domain|uniref:helix-turn-helix domain-containing protein n=1 Tax=Halodesulfovibrio sp. TaxID=1912772 RepID=UPI0025F9873D|nr:helix-turn-helix transcriptional regulator [Halodesulfovibrio sp.]MCT4627036.1 helix-turn-helix domain-containing protein [Halodesulfovibrio sp.]